MPKCQPGCDCGRHNRAHTEADFWGRIDYLSSDCWLWVDRLDRDGYGKFSCRWSKEGRAHRLAWELSNGPIPDGLFVLHKCDVPNCVNPEHLFLGTQADNLRDAREKGRRNYTEEWKTNIGNAHRGMKRSPEARALMSKRAKERANRPEERRKYRERAHKQPRINGRFAKVEER